MKRLQRLAGRPGTECLLNIYNNVAYLNCALKVYHELALTPCDWSCSRSATSVMRPRSACSTCSCFSLYSFIGFSSWPSARNRWSCSCAGLREAALGRLFRCCGFLGWGGCDYLWRRCCCGSPRRPPRIFILTICGATWLSLLFWFWEGVGPSLPTFARTPGWRWCRWVGRGELEHLNFIIWGFWGRWLWPYLPRCVSWGSTAASRG